jgi:chemotaxis signal transduction protein
LSLPRPNFGSRAIELRLAFDRSFSEPIRYDSIPTEDFLVIRVGSEPYAIRLAEIAGLSVNKEITPLHRRSIALLGLAGFRGTLVPIYDLHALIGYPMTEAPRWLVIASAASVAFAFAAFDGHLRVSRDAVIPPSGGEHSRNHIREFIHWRDHTRPVVSIRSVLDNIRSQESVTGR